MFYPAGFGWSLRFDFGEWGRRVLSVSSYLQAKALFYQATYDGLPLKIIDLIQTSPSYVFYRIPGLILVYLGLQFSSYSRYLGVRRSRDTRLRDAPSPYLQEEAYELATRRNRGVAFLYLILADSKWRRRVLRRSSRCRRVRRRSQKSRCLFRPDRNESQKGSRESILSDRR